MCMQDFLMLKQTAGVIRVVKLPITTATLIVPVNNNRVALGFQVPAGAANVWISSVIPTTTGQGFRIIVTAFPITFFNALTSPGLIKGPLYGWADAATDLIVSEDVYFGPGSELPGIERV